MLWINYKRKEEEKNTIIINQYLTTKTIVNNCQKFFIINTKNKKNKIKKIIKKIINYNQIITKKKL